MTLDYSVRRRDEAARFAGALRSVDPGARVPTCPDWAADDLLWHLAEVFSFWGTVVRERLDDPDGAELPDSARPDDHAGLLALFDTANQALTAALDDTPDDVSVWTWSRDNSVGFVRRRMAHEALIHRLDAEVTAGSATGTDIDADFAADGVAEALEHFYGGYPPWAQWDPHGPVGRLQADDTGDEWTFRLGGFSGVSPNTGKSYEDEPSLELVGSGRPSFTLTGTARDLDAWIWNRPTLVEPTAAGDKADFQQFGALIKNGVD